MYAMPTAPGPTGEFPFATPAEYLAFRQQAFPYDPSFALSGTGAPDYVVPQGTASSMYTAAYPFPGGQMGSSAWKDAHGGPSSWQPYGSGLPPLQPMGAAAGEGMLAPGYGIPMGYWNSVDLSGFDASKVASSSQARGGALPFPGTLAAGQAWTPEALGDDTKALGGAFPPLQEGGAAVGGFGFGLPVQGPYGADSPAIGTFEPADLAHAAGQSFAPNKIVSDISSCCNSELTNHGASSTETTP